MTTKIASATAAVLLTVLMAGAAVADGAPIEVSSGNAGVSPPGGTWDLTANLQGAGFSAAAGRAGFDLLGFFDSLASNTTQVGWGDVFLNGTQYLGTSHLDLTFIHDPLDLFFNPVPGVPLSTCGIIRPCLVTGSFVMTGFLDIDGFERLNLVGRGRVSAVWLESATNYSVAFVFVPEPSTLLLLAGGVAGVIGAGYAMRRQR